MCYCHPIATGGTFRNELSTAADLSETSLEQSLIDIAAFVDERGLKIAMQGVKLIIPKELQFTAERILRSPQRVGTADNDINAMASMGMMPQGYRINHYLTDTDAFFIMTDAPNGMKQFVRVQLKLQLKVTLILVMSDLKQEKDILLVFLTQEVFLVH